MEIELSREALVVLKAVFWNGEQSTLKSGPTCFYRSKHQSAFDELVENKLITVEKLDGTDVFLFRGTNESREIWRTRLSSGLAALEGRKSELIAGS